MLLRNGSTGGLEVYDIANNQITNAVSMGTVGSNWQAMAFGNFSSIPGQTDMIMRDTNTGAFEVYNIANNQITGAALLGAVGLNWGGGRFAADPPTASAGGSDSSTSQLVQAMAGFGGGSADGLNAAPLSAETSQQPLVTTSQHV
jgi:hypothetical protein